MEDKDKRSSMFTVRDAENVMITFSILAIALLLGVFFHQFVSKATASLILFMP